MRFVLQDPKIAAVAAAVMQEEEDRELQEALEATGMMLYPEEMPEHYFGYRRRRMMSIGNISAPPILSSGHRFHSISNPTVRRRKYAANPTVSLRLPGGYGNFLAPSSRKLSYSNARFSMGSKTRRIDDYFIESDGDEADDEYDRLNNRIDDYNESPRQYQLSIPHGVRKLSSKFVSDSFQNSLPRTRSRAASATSHAAAQRVRIWSVAARRSRWASPRTPSRRSARARPTCWSRFGLTTSKPHRAHAVPVKEHKNRSTIKTRSNCGRPSAKL